MPEKGKQLRVSAPDGSLPSAFMLEGAGTHRFFDASANIISALLYSEIITPFEGIQIIDDITGGRLNDLFDVDALNEGRKLVNSLDFINQLLQEDFNRESLDIERLRSKGADRLANDMKQHLTSRPKNSLLVFIDDEVLVCTRTKADKDSLCRVYNPAGELTLGHNQGAEPMQFDNLAQIISSNKGIVVALGQPDKIH